MGELNKELVEALKSAMRILKAIRSDTVAPYSGAALPMLDWIVCGEDSIAVVALKKACKEI
jgi:hypothetical protein